MQSAWPHVALLMASPRLCFLLWLLQLSQSLSSSSGGIGGAFIFLAWLSSIAGERPILKAIGILLRWGWSPLMAFWSPWRQTLQGSLRAREEKLILKYPGAQGKHFYIWQSRIELKEEVNILTKEEGYTWAGL